MSTMLLLLLVLLAIVTTTAMPANEGPVKILKLNFMEGEAAGRIEKRGLTLTEYRARELASHNAYRSKHGANPLVLDAVLNQEAQDFAEYLLNQGNMAHCTSAIKNQNTTGIGCDSSTTTAGENIAWTSAQTDSYSATGAWYSEVKDYDFCNHGFGYKTGHFTQVVWRATTKLGIGLASNSQEGTYVVARYVSPGNYIGQFANEVGPAPDSLNRPECGAVTTVATTTTTTTTAATITTEENEADGSRSNECFRNGFSWSSNTPYPNLMKGKYDQCYLVCEDPNDEKLHWILDHGWIKAIIDCIKDDGSTGYCLPDKNMCE